jgi:predicted solute-binding protein
MSIEAMKLALEALRPISHNSTDDPRGQADKAIKALEEALKQEQGEPVAWYDDIHQDFSRVQRIGWKPLVFADTTPQERKPLTDDELYEIVRAEGKVLKAHAWEIVQNLQAKLRSKNETNRPVQTKTQGREV